MDENVERAPDNLFLKGNFAPVEDELNTQALRVEGQIPGDLEGTFLRNGPNPHFAPKGRYHWFDGDGMVHAVRIQRGRASYLNRFVRTAGFIEEERAGKALYTGGLEPPDFSKAEPFKNTANTALVRHGGKLLTLWESGPPHALSLETLETIGREDFGGKLKSPFTAHPKVDPVTGEMLFFGYSPLPPFLTFGIVSKSGELTKTFSIDVPCASLMHDFAITENYALFLDSPMKFRPELIFKGKPPVRWEPDAGLRIGVLPRHGSAGDIKWLVAPPCFFFHVANAYEEGEEIVLRACRMTASSIVGSDVALSGVPKHEVDVPKLHEWRLNPRTGSVRERALDDLPSEFPRLSPTHVGRPYRYTYGARQKAAVGPDAVLFSGLFKLDHETGKLTEQKPNDGRLFGEFVFVPREKAQAEDDGYLMGFVYEPDHATSSLTIFDAQALDAPALARIFTPRRVPFGFHGEWVSA